ncbi:MAG: glyoxalase [Alphaproteobacteria bacterium]|nr:glyoxalase [Alphaproteobacteria bacterium]
MPLEKLEHYTIRSLDMEATRDFYRDICGLKVGPRPPLDFAGYWLYCGKIPVVHLVPLDNPIAIRGEVNVPSVSNGAQPGTGAVDHVAFGATNVEGMKKHLEARKMPYKERIQAGGFLHQIFLNDPNGVTVELNYHTAKLKKLTARGASMGTAIKRGTKKKATVRKANGRRPSSKNRRAA